MKNSYSSLYFFILLVAAVTICLLFDGALTAGLSMSFAITCIIPPNYEVSSGALTRVSWWHGSPEQKFVNLQVLVGAFTENAEKWGVPADMLATLQDLLKRLEAVLNKIHSPEASTAYRTKRNEITAELMVYIRQIVRSWCIGQVATGAIPLVAFNLLGFLLPGQMSRHHGRKHENSIVPSVNATTTGMDTVMVTVDDSANKQGNRTRHAKPKGVQFVDIVITDEDGNEVFHEIGKDTQRVIHLDHKYRGQVLNVKAAFLTHTNDPANYSTLRTVSMPKDYEDLIHTKEKQKAAKKQQED